MPRDTRSTRSDGSGFQASRADSTEKGIFRKEGEYWTVGYAGRPFRLKDTKGLGYLAHLLRHPGTEFHVLDLVGGIAGEREEVAGDSTHGLPPGEEDLAKAGIHIASLGDAGEMLDEQAKAAYRRRLSELREELGEAKGLGKVARAEQVEAEIDALTRELARAVGLGGRNRKAASASERARQSTTKTIKAVVDRIVQSDSALGNILTRCIRTGTFCSYQPDPDFSIAWEFATPDFEPTEALSPSTNDDALPASASRTRPAIAPAVLEVSPFLLAERTAFVGREPERAAIRAAIDGALSGHGSLVMLGGGPGWAKAASRWRWRTTRGAWASAAPLAIATKETSLFPFFLLSSSLKATWHKRRALIISVGIWAITRPNWPRSRQACVGSFQISRNH